MYTNKAKLKTKLGYTLIEMLLAMTILILVLQAGMALFITGMKDWQNKDDTTNLLTQALTVMNYIRPDISNATSIAVAEDREIEFDKREGVVAATDSGIFYYNEEFARWDDISNNLPGGISILCLLESNTGALLAGASNGAVYKTTDRGRTWSPTGTLSGAAAIQDLIESSDNTAIYAATTPTGDVFKTTDEGLNWVNTGNLISGATEPTSVNALAEDLNGTLYAGTDFINNVNLFKSTNGGITWTDCSLFTNWWNNSYQYQRQLTIHNHGNTDLPMNYSVKLRLDHYEIDQAGKSLSNGNDIRIVYWNGSNYIELDRANEGQWNDRDMLAEIWFPTQITITAGSSDNNYYLYYGNPAPGTPPTNRDNIYLFWDEFDSLDTINTWDTLGTPSISGGEVRLGAGDAIATKISYSQAAFELDLRWNVHNETGWCGWLDAIDTSNPPYTIWTTLGTSDFFPVKARNAGSSYTGDLVPLDGSQHVWTINYDQPDNITVWTYDKKGKDLNTSINYTPNQPLVIRNVDSSNTMRINWLKIRQSILPEPVVTLDNELSMDNFSVLSLLVDQDNTVYAGTDLSGEVFKTVDQGTTWEYTNNLTDSGTDATSIFVLKSAGNDLYAGTTPDGNVFVSSDSGNTWQNTADLSGASNILSLFIKPNRDIYAGTNPNGDTFESTSGGASWNNLPNISGASNVFALSSISDRIKYYWTGNLYKDTQNPDDQLSRVIAGKTYQLEEGVLKDFQINYYKSDHTPADTSTHAGRAEIKLVEIILTLEKNDRKISLTKIVKLKQ